MLLLVTSLAPTLSMSSLALVLHGLWLPSTGKHKEKSSEFPLAGTYNTNQQLNISYLSVSYTLGMFHGLPFLFSLGFSVTVFCIEALLAILILLARRSPVVGGELGGPKLFKTLSSGAFVFFWCFYVMISALEAYDVIEPGF